MILSRKQIEVWKNSTIPVDGCYGPLIRNLLDTIDDLLADRPAPSERNRVRREAMEEAANLVENSVDENTAGILTIRSDIGDKIRALAAAPQGMEKKAFLQGFAVAVGSLVRDHDQPSMAVDIIRGNGVTLMDLENCGAETFDLKHIRKAWRERR